MSLPSLIDAAGGCRGGMRGVSKKTVIYTTAPAEYDWRFTSDLGVAGATHQKIVRKVAVDAERVEEQCDRYLSGLHMAVGESEWTM